PPRLLADVRARPRRGGPRPAGRLAGRILLSVPRQPLRPRRARVQGRPGAHQPAGAAAPVPERYPGAHRRRRGRGVNAALRMLSGLRDWVDARYPLMRTWNEHLAKYYAPKNFNIWYYFGSLALLVLVIQIVT